MKEEKQQLWIILLIVFIGFVGTSIAYPIFPPLFASRKQFYHPRSIERVIITAMSATAIIFGLMAIFPSPILAFLLFGLVGLSISTSNTNMTIEVSNSADATIQGEAMGAQLSLRMLGDAIICLAGGFLIVSSVILPIAFSCLIALIAAGVFARFQQSFTQGKRHSNGK